jgi:hypothetical protein
MHGSYPHPWRRISAGYRRRGTRAGAPATKIAALGDEKCRGWCLPNTTLLDEVGSFLGLSVSFLHGKILCGVGVTPVGSAPRGSDEQADGVNVGRTLAVLAYEAHRAADEARMRGDLVDPHALALAVLGLHPEVPRQFAPALVRLIREHLDELETPVT